MDNSKRWDLIALERLMYRKAKQDISYENILKPSIISKLKHTDCSKIIDIGCGTGELTYEVSKFSKGITAIDTSKNSIALANKYNFNTNIEYINQNIVDFKVLNFFTSGYSNMALMNMTDIKTCLLNTYAILKNNSTFVFTITHPAFWPLYWNYYNKNNFDYLKQSKILKEFKTQNKVFTNLKTNHYHRPISNYINTAISAGFVVKDCQELPDLDNNYWYPRFLLIELFKPS